MASEPFAFLVGDVLDVLATFPAGHFDAVLTDPPYNLGFMGKAWDRPGATFFERRAERSNDFDHVGGNHNPADAADRARTRLSENAKFQAWCEAWGREMLRTLRPGAWLLAFGGTRTYHRLAVAVEDAGFEVRDSILAAAWTYGSGFPKSLDLSKAVDRAAGAEREVVGYYESPEGTTGWKGQNKVGAVDFGASRYEDGERRPVTAPASADSERWSGYGTALAPAWEPVVAAMRPLDGTFAQNALRHGVGGLNVDGGRVAASGPSPAVERRASSRRSGKVPGHHGDPIARAEREAAGKVTSQTSPERYMAHRAAELAGRWPKNAVLCHGPGCRQVGDRRVPTGTAVKPYGDADGTEAVPEWECEPSCPVAELDEQAGERSHNARGAFASGQQAGWSGGRTNIGHAGTATREVFGYGDRGAASRFYYCAKASGAERSAGLEWRQGEWPAEVLGFYGRARSRLLDHMVECDNAHPTVKPIDLCRYLATLLLPPARPDGSPRRLLVPFSGVGSEVVGALLAGWDEVVGVELEPESAEVARQRARWWSARMRETGATDPATIIEWGRERPSEQARFAVSGPLFEEGGR